MITSNSLTMLTMLKTEKGPIQSQQYIKVLKGALLAALTGVTIQGCTRTDGSAPLPTGASIETVTPAIREEGGKLSPQVIVTESELGDPIVTIGEKDSTKKSTTPEEVSVSIVLDGDEQPSLEKQSPSNSGSQGTEFSSLEPERLKDVIKSMEKNEADDAIVEDGRTVQIYSTKLKNGTTFINVKETVQHDWDSMQSNVVFYDKGARYVAYNTVQFGTHYLGEDMKQELRFGKGKTSAIVRNAYVTSDPSKVSVLLSSRRVDDSLGFLTRNGDVSIIHQREENDPITSQRTTNIGGYVESTNDFLHEWEWLLDQSKSNHVYGVGYQSNGRFTRESIGDPLEINPSGNIE